MIIKNKGAKKFSKENETFVNLVLFYIFYVSKPGRYKGR